jgi:hypothetical protein
LVFALTLHVPTLANASPGVNRFVCGNFASCLEDFAGPVGDGECLQGSDRVGPGRRTAHSALSRAEQAALSQSVSTFSSSGIESASSQGSLVQGLGTGCGGGLARDWIRRSAFRRTENVSAKNLPRGGRDSSED